MYMLKKITNYISPKKSESNILSLRPHPHSLTAKYIKENCKNIYK